MKRLLTIFLQMVIVALAICAIVFLLWEPQLEGRNVGATLFEIYFTDPFLAFAYIGSIPFFVGLYQAYKALVHVRQGRTFSPTVIKSLHTIKNCAVAIIGFAIVGEIFIMLNTSDDRAGGVAMGVFIILCSIVVAIVSKMLERRVRRGVN